MIKPNDSKAFRQISIALSKQNANFVAQRATTRGLDHNPHSSSGAGDNTDTPVSIVNRTLERYSALLAASFPTLSAQAWEAAFNITCGPHRQATDLAFIVGSLACDDAGIETRDEIEADGSEHLKELLELTPAQSLFVTEACEHFWSSPTQVRHYRDTLEMLSGVPADIACKGDGDGDVHWEHDVNRGQIIHTRTGTVCTLRFNRVGSKLTLGTAVSRPDGFPSPMIQRGYESWIKRIMHCFEPEWGWDQYAKDLANMEIDKA